MIDVIRCFVLMLIVIQILLLIFMNKSNKSWIYSIISVFTSILIFIMASQIEEIVNINSPGLGEIAAGFITGVFRIISLVLSEIILYKSIKKYLIKINISENSNYKFIRFLIAFSIIFIGYIIFIISQVGMENFGI